MGSEQKVAVITGASQGIGAALVKAYRDRNYRVVATALSMEPLNGDDVMVVSGDIADRKTADVQSRRAWRGSGASTRSSTTPASLSVNPSLSIPRPTTRRSWASMSRASSTSHNSPVAEMEKQGSGHIVQITTSLVDHAIAGVPAVLAALTKGGLNAATKSLAIEYAQRGIRVNAVAPGTIKTPMHSVEEYAQLAALHPVGRLGEISDIVDAILYLEAASFVTGRNPSRRRRPERRPLMGAPLLLRRALRLAWE